MDLLLWSSLFDQVEMKFYIDFRAVPLINSWEFELDFVSVELVCEGTFGRRGAISNIAIPTICGNMYRDLEKKNHAIM